MSLIRYEPFSIFGRLQNELNRTGLNDLFANESVNVENSNSVDRYWRPAVDIQEEAKQFVITADLPGVDPKDIEITMEDSVLSIKGQRTVEEVEREAGYKRVERAQGTFHRRFSLPDTADADNIEAKGKDGVLKIIVSKQEKAQARRITVN